jgi:hypothetical protein
MKQRRGAPALIIVSGTRKNSGHGFLMSNRNHIDLAWLWRFDFNTGLSMI